MIITRNVTKYFGDFCALKDISFRVNKGEIVGFLGQNGAGKTTLMRIITSFLPATSGEVLIDRINTRDDSIAVRRKVGYLPETPPLYIHMTVRDYLKFAAQLKDVPPRDVKKRVDHALSECSLKDVQQKVIGILSKGYKQRVGIAQAIINDPEVLILDEPTSGLDPVQIQQVRGLIRNLEHKRTVILSTHILSEIEQVVKRVMIIKEGSIIADDSIERLLKAEQRKVVFKLKGDPEVIERVLREDPSVKGLRIELAGRILVAELHVDAALEHFNGITDRLLKNGVGIIEVREKPLSLEEKFIELTTRIA